MLRSNPCNIAFGLILTAYFLISPGFSFATPQYEALLGEWDVETEGGQYAFVFKFFLHENKLAGSFVGQTGEAEMQNLNFADNQVAFTVELDMGGQTMSIDFEASISGDNLEGFLAMEFGEAGITGKKRTSDVRRFSR